jgi:hypothetical protein
MRPRTRAARSQQRRRPEGRPRSAHRQADRQTQSPFAPARRFVTSSELEKLGLGHLVGTSLLRAYMHGYFIDNRLYGRAKALADPFAYDTYRQQRVEKKLAEERKSRISIRRKLPKVLAAAGHWKEAWGGGQMCRFYCAALWKETFRTKHRLCC